MKKKKISIQYLERPSKHLAPFEAQHLVAGLRQVGRKCFAELPDYQCFNGPEALGDKVITVARNEHGAVVGFASALLLEVEGVELPVLHLGLTCVDPEYRGLRLTHKLASRLTIGYLLKNRPFGKVWFSNVACVLSSVGNVALNFDNVYPSPFLKKPCETQLKIARTISQEYRKEIFIDDEAWLDEEAFVMRGSVRGTVFQKDANDTRYHHRNGLINAYYKEIIDFADGDEVVQIGQFSVGTFIRYVMPNRIKSKRWFAPPKRLFDTRVDDVAA